MRSNTIRPSDSFQRFGLAFLLGYTSPYPYEGRWKVSLAHKRSFPSGSPAHLGTIGGEPNAFAPIVQARPFPIFGRPVHLRDHSHRLRPGSSPQALRIPPHGGHPALRRIQIRRFQVHLGCLQLSLSCPFRLLHPFSSLRPTRRYPCLRISAPGLGPSGTLTSLMRLLPGTHYRPVLHPLVFSRFPGVSDYTGYLAPPISRRDEEGFSSCSTCPGHRAIAITPLE